MRKLNPVWQGMILMILGVAAAAAQPGPPPHLDPGCVADCRQDVRICRQGILASARNCRETCATQLAAVKAACDDDPSSDACKTARAAAKDCTLPCSKARGAASRECKKDARSCVTDCRTVDPSPNPDSKDPVCARDCASVLRECLATARDDSQTCRSDNCAQLLAAVEAACHGDGESDACRAAREAAFDCLRDCRDGLQDDTRTCVRAHETCVRACPTPGPEEPTPTATPTLTSTDTPTP